MKYTVLYILVAFLAVGSVQAQKLSKEEKKMAKEWKKRQKSMKPLDYKKMVEETEELTTKIADANSAKEEISGQLSAKDNQLSSLKSRNEQLKKLKEGGTRNKVDESGVIYKVQVGAYKEMDLTNQTANDGNDLRSEEIDGGIKRYTLGRFRNLADAEKFKAYIQKMGVRDAFIVGFRDGVRDESLTNGDQ